MFVSIRSRSYRRVAWTTLLLWILTMFWALPVHATHGGIPAGYSEYYIPTSTDQLWDIFENLDNDPNLGEGRGLHAVIAVTPSTDSTTIYYDHWENGYTLDRTNPNATADEIYHVDQDEVQEFEGSNIPVRPRGTATYYDGRDRILVLGGPAAVTFSAWPESVGTVYSLAWEIYPIKPLTSHYTIPIGENLAEPPTSYLDFTRVYVVVQSVSNNTTFVQIDNPNHAGIEVNATLGQGEVTELYGVDAGTHISATHPVQVQFIVGRAYPTNQSEADGFSAVPDDLWDNEYYNPVGGFEEWFRADPGQWVGRTNLFLFNPHATPLTVYYEDLAGTGTFQIPARGVISYEDGTGRYVPRNSGVYLRADRNFWGIGSGDTESMSYDWGYSLVPVWSLSREYVLGWAPGSSEAVPTVNGSPVFITPVQDDTTVFIDFSPVDGVVDRTFRLDRLQIEKVFDPDNENTGMFIWATAPIALAWGEDPDTAETGNPYLDVGHTTVPSEPGWMDLVLNVTKTIDPTAIPEGPGNAVTVTLAIPTYSFLVSDITITDTLAPAWNYVPNSSIITWPDGTVLTGPTAEPTVTGREIVWGPDVLPPEVLPDQMLIVEFLAQTTITTPGGINVNEVDVGGKHNDIPFTSHDNATVYLTNVTVDKDTTTPIVQRGDVATYTIAVNAIGILTGTTIMDTLPPGFTYIAGTIETQGAVRTSVLEPSPGDRALQWGTWDLEAGGRVTITFSALVDAPPATYDNTVVIHSPMVGEIDDAGTAAQDPGTPAGQDPEPDEDVTVVDATAVELLYLRAVAQPGAVLLEWETAVEVDNYGFSVLRGQNRVLADAQEVGFVPAAGYGGGAAYQWTDRAVEPGVEYVYWLADIDTLGQTSIHGPVTAAGLPDMVVNHLIYLPIILR